jgi:uncharacterized RDD family membrane protein YckC
VFNKYGSKKKNPQNRAGNFRKSLASATDSLILLMIRGLLLQIYGSLVLINSIEKFRQDFIAEFGTEIPKLVATHTKFIIHHWLFTEILLVIAVLILIGAVYHGYFLSSSWRATIGKRLFEIIANKDEEEKISFWRGGLYYLFSLLPFCYIIHIGTYSAVNSITIYQAIANSKANLAAGFIFALWLQISFFTKSKSTITELFLGIKLFEGRIKAKLPWNNDFL